MTTNKFSTAAIAKIAIVAALYVALCLAIAPLSFGSIQLRFSEILILLCFVDKRYSYSLIIGCFIANLFSPFGIIDVIVGTFATAITAIFVSRSKNLFFASLWAPIFCVIIVFEIYFIEGIPFWVVFSQVIIGEIIVVNIIGYIIFKLILKKDNLLKFLKF